MEKYFPINEQGCSVRCKLYADAPRGLRRVIIAPHGFGGHKDNRAAARFAERVLSKYKSVGIVTFDLPCHGDDVRKTLSLADCDLYFSLVLNHARTQLGAQELFAYAASFGGYLTLKYMAEHGSPFSRVVLRCPAVNMYDSMRERILKNDELARLESGRDADAGFDRKVRISPAFLEELREFDLPRRDFLELSEQIRIIHGSKDEIIPPGVVSRFADDNLIELITVENADHRFTDPLLMTEAIKAALEFMDL